MPTPTRIIGIDWSKLDTRSLKKVIENHNKTIRKDDAILSLKGGRKAILPLVKKHFTASTQVGPAGKGKITFTHKQGISTYTLNKVGTTARKAEDAKYKADRVEQLENRKQKKIRRGKTIVATAKAILTDTMKAQILKEKKDKKEKKAKIASTKIQKVVRGKAGKKKAVATKKEKVASKIQKVVRGKKGRKDARKTRKEQGKLRPKDIKISRVAERAKIASTRIRLEKTKKFKKNKTGKVGKVGKYQYTGHMTQFYDAKIETKNPLHNWSGPAGVYRTTAEHLRSPLFAEAMATLATKPTFPSYNEQDAQKARRREGRAKKERGAFLQKKKASSVIQKAYRKDLAWRPPKYDDNYPTIASRSESFAQSQNRLRRREMARARHASGQR
tara:strand:+ start:2757 stop:3917 length:1161 start_codon:yes stop_codon:yes gene_type:complete